MSKSDAPALRLVIEPGPRLVPASAFDAERLDTYKVGRTIRLTPVEEADRKDIRRWWAILNRAVRDAKTPWRTAAQASEAIKLALGIVEYGKTVSGKFMQWPKSLKELDDQELADAVRDMAAIIKDVTGVDPLDWQRESADIGQDESGSVSEAGEDSAAADQEDGADPGTAQTSDADAPSSDPRDPKVILNLKAEAVDKFIRVATDKNVPDAKDRRRVLELTKDAWKRELPHHPDFVKACLTTADKVVKGEMPVEKAKEYLAGLVK